MKLITASITNFRCFGSEPQIIEFEDNLTALLGANGTGKSSVLAALGKVFGLSKADRTLHKSDFYRAPGASAEESVALSIELRFEFPELEDDEEIDSLPTAAMFRHMTVSEAGQTPYCVARLNAEWSPGLLAEGEIDEQLEWVLGVDAEGNEETRAVTGAQRSLIAVHYIPATRDPIRHIRQSAGSILHGFLKAVRWSEDTKQAVLREAEGIRDAIASEAGVETLNDLIESCWGELHREGTHTNVAIQPVSKKFEELIRQVDMVFSPGDSEEESSIELLSDGQRSLFYIALVAMSFDIKNDLDADEAEGFEVDQIRAPILTLLAVEEPENHVSPQYLGRIVSLLKRIGSEDSGQVVITSHSASLMARVDPESVRYLSQDSATRRSNIKSLTLPQGNGEREKYIREAVKAYPELYFAKFVVLGEGASEEIVIPKVMKAIYGRELDDALISFVPLGGRHVNHMWKLLDDLGIPNVTLLDLDLGREGGGWGRIKYALEQLLELGIDESELIEPISRQELEQMHTWDGNSLESDMRSWIEKLEEYDVYFSSPLDLDYAMLSAFLSQYNVLEEGARGPRDSADSDLVASVLGENSEAEEFYLGQGSEYLKWYRYLFFGRGKPSTHAISLQRIPSVLLKRSAPKVLKRMARKLSGQIQTQTSES